MYELDTCQFNFTSMVDLRTKQVIGIESSWYDLKREFSREGDGCKQRASYYRTISADGPQLFAVDDDHAVYYHHDDVWSLYLSGRILKFGIMNSVDPHPPRSTARID
jgi:hypothetical protein